MKKAGITAIEIYLPETLLTNDQLAQELGNWTSAEILNKTGIVVRHIAASEECSSDLGVAAAKKLFERGAWCPLILIFCYFVRKARTIFYRLQRV